jgi:hypothetical protein
VAAPQQALGPNQGVGEHGRAVAARSWQDAAMGLRRYRATVVQLGRDRVVVPVPFDPDQAFGPKGRHHVAGTVNGMAVRAVIEATEGGFGFVLGSAWRRDRGVGPGDEVEVSLAPEGPAREDLPADLAAALEENPAAGEFFDSLAQFYRKGYLRWIEATRRSPQRRAVRVAETVRFLAEGHKSRPAP